MSWHPSHELLAPLAPWFERARRQLPWRAADLSIPHPDPYAVLVSELMLQQTQVTTVVPYFIRWMAQFPDAAALAAAPDAVVHKAWEGLGYYRRARFLQAAAGAVAQSGWPEDLAGLMRLPGLGPYTAAAVGAIAFQWPTPALDGNAFRVLARLLLIEGDPRGEAERLRAWLAPALEVHGPSRLTQALMELGATHCGPSPDCSACPLARHCAAHAAGRSHQIPPPRPRTPPREVSLWLVALRAKGQLLLHRPAATGLLAGLWRWPAFERDLPGLEPVAPPQPTLVGWPGWTQVYTHRREVVLPLHLELGAPFPTAPEMLWVPADELDGLPMGRRDSRLRELLALPGTAPMCAPEAAALTRACEALSRSGSGPGAAGPGSGGH